VYPGHGVFLTDHEGILSAIGAGSAGRTRSNCVAGSPAA